MQVFRAPQAASHHDEMEASQELQLLSDTESDVDSEDESQGGKSDVSEPGTSYLQLAKRKLRVLKRDLSGPFPIIIVVMLLLAAYNSVMFFENPWEVLSGIVVGLLSGVVIGYFYRSKLRRKQEKIVIMNNMTMHDLLKLQVLRIVLGEIPSWVKQLTFAKVEWVNDIMHQLWPYYDRIFCQMLRENIEPLFEYYKPASVKYMGFKTLSLGSSPLEIVGIRPERTDDHVVLDVDVVWGGSALVQLAIHAFGAKMSPKMTDVVFQGTMKIILKPLVDTPPFFGAISVTFMKPPTFYFDLDFGKGIPMAGAVKKLMIPFIKGLLEDMMVWPNRYVMPWLDESITGPLDDLYLRPSHCLHIKVISARNLPDTDIIGKSDPFVTMYTRQTRMVKTSVIKNNLNPVWNEEFDLLVEEMYAQPLHIEVYDLDFMIMGAEQKELLGRHKLWLSELEPGVEKTMWLPLGLEDFSEDSCGSGRGELQLSLLCNPIREMHTDATGTEFGALIVRVVEAKDLLSKDWFGQADAYVSMKVVDKHEHKAKGESKHLQKKSSTVIKNNANPVWNETIEFVSIPRDSILEVQVKDKDFGRNNVIGHVNVKVSEISQKSEEAVFPLLGAQQGTLELELQWIRFR